MTPAVDSTDQSRQDSAAPPPPSPLDALADIQARLEQARHPLADKEGKPWPNAWRTVYERDVALLLSALRGEGILASLVHS